MVDKSRLVDNADASLPLWNAYLDYNGSRDDLADHVASCLADLHYYEYSISSDGYSSKSHSRIFFSFDLKTEVLVLPGHEHGAAYASDYIITITQHDKVPRHLIEPSYFSTQTLAPLWEVEGEPPPLPIN